MDKKIKAERPKRQSIFEYRLTHIFDMSTLLAPSSKPPFKIAARVTSDEVVCYHEYTDEPVVASRERHYNVNARSGGPLKDFLETRAHDVLNGKSAKFLADFRKAIDDPFLAVKLQNSVATSAFLESLPFTISEGVDCRAALTTLSGTLRDMAPDIGLPESPPPETDIFKQYHQLADFLKEVGECQGFLTPEGSRLLQRCLKEAVARCRKPHEDKGSRFSTSFEYNAEQALSIKRWLPSSNSPPADNFHPIKLKDYTALKEDGGFKYVEVDQAALRKAVPYLHLAAETYVNNSKRALLKACRASGIDEAEFSIPAMSDLHARESLMNVIDYISPKGLGGKMCRKALSNPQLCVIMLDRSMTNDYYNSFRIDDMKSDRRKGSYVAGFSGHMDHVYVGCIGEDMGHTVVEELVHNAFNNLYKNNHATYAHKDASNGEKNGISFHAEKHDFQKALQDDLEALARVDEQPGSWEDKMDRATKRLRKDIHMHRRSYDEPDFNAEIATKIIAMQTVGEWNGRLNRRWSHLVEFIKDKIGKDVDEWIARDSGVSAPVASTEGTHAAQVKKEWKPEGRT